MTCIAIRRPLGAKVYVTLPIRPPAAPRRTLPLFPIPTFLSGASNTLEPGAVRVARGLSRSGAHEHVHCDAQCQPATFAGGKS